MTWVSIMALLISQSYTYASAPCESNEDIRSQHNHAMGSNGLAPQTLEPRSLAQKSHNPSEHDMSRHMQQDKQKNTAQNMHQQMQQKSQQRAFETDCCDEECSCNTGTYSSVTFPNFATFSSLRLVSESLGLYLSSIQDGFLSSLRKPPIFN